MKYEEFLTCIEGWDHPGIALGLERIERLLEILDNPQKELKYIHVAGTNGKGSVCAFLDSVLRGAGFRVGRYISPTLYDYRERIQVNNRYIEKDEVVALFEKVQKACESMKAEGRELPTVFEVETALAFLYFKEKKCDYVLLEVGMGGRLDSTNVIENPEVAVITSIALDHTRMLGSTLTEIAEEKGGIIKAGSPVILGPQDREAMITLEAICKKKGIIPVVADLDRLEHVGWDTIHQVFSYKEYQKLELSLLGDYQCMNAAVALEVLDLLKEKETAITEDVIRRGMKEAKWAGRFEVVLREPFVVVDGAHNPAGAKALVETIQNHFQDKKILLVMGVFKDKDYRKIAETLSSVSDSICCYTPQHERKLSGEKLAEAIKPYFEHITVKETVEEAIAYAMEQVDKKDMVVSFGSLSTIRAAETAVKRWGESRGTCRKNIE